MCPRTLNYVAAAVCVRVCVCAFVLGALASLPILRLYGCLWRQLRVACAALLMVPLLSHMPHCACYCVDPWLPAFSLTHAMPCHAMPRHAQNDETQNRVFKLRELTTEFFVQAEADDGLLSPDYVLPVINAYVDLPFEEPSKIQSCACMCVYVVVCACTWLCVRIGIYTCHHLTLTPRRVRTHCRLKSFELYADIVEVVERWQRHPMSTAAYQSDTQQRGVSQHHVNSMSACQHVSRQCARVRTSVRNPFC